LSHFKLPYHLFSWTKHRRLWVNKRITWQYFCIVMKRGPLSWGRNAKYRYSKTEFPWWNYPEWECGILQNEYFRYLRKLSNIVRGIESGELICGGESDKSRQEFVPSITRKATSCSKGQHICFLVLDLEQKLFSNTKWRQPSSLSQPRLVDLMRTLLLHICRCLFSVNLYALDSTGFLCEMPS
jgi:hypothetical protein